MTDKPTPITEDALADLRAGKPVASEWLDAIGPLIAALDEARARADRAAEDERAIVGDWLDVQAREIDLRANGLSFDEFEKDHRAALWLERSAQRIRDGLAPRSVAEMNEIAAGPHRERGE